VATGDNFTEKHLLVKASSFPVSATTRESSTIIYDVKGQHSLIVHGNLESTTAEEHHTMVGSYNHHLLLAT